MWPGWSSNNTPEKQRKQQQQTNPIMTISHLS